MFLFSGSMVALGAQTQNDSAAGGVVFLIGLAMALLAVSLWIYGMMNAYRTATNLGGI
jgi:hypothetical protein